MAHISQISLHCQASPQQHAPGSSDTHASATSTSDASGSNIERQDETSIARAYHVASIARARLQQQAERRDHDLRLLISHANLLDRLAERLEEVEPDFTLESPDHLVINSLDQKTNLPKPIRHARIEDILCRLDLSECTDEDDVCDEVYDDSDDDLDEPWTPETEEIELGQAFQEPLVDYGRTEHVEKPIKRSQRDSIDLTAPSWKGFSVRLPFYQKATPIITVTEL